MSFLTSDVHITSSGREQTSVKLNKLLQPLQILPRWTVKLELCAVLSKITCAKVFIEVTHRANRQIEDIFVLFETQQYKQGFAQC